MRQFVSPELELIRLDVVDVITASGDVAPTSTAAIAPATSVIATTVAPSAPATATTTAAPATSTAAPAPTVTDAGLDNEVSANKWVF